MRRYLSQAMPAAVLLALSTGAFAADAAPAKGGIGLMDLYLHSMPVGGILTVLSVICFSLALQWTFTLKRDDFIPPGLADDIHNAFAEGVTPESIENARNAVGTDSSFLGNVLAAALDKHPFGYQAMREAAESVGISEHNKYTSKVAWLSLFSSSATLLGLLGTVSGIIGSFLKMGDSANVDPQKLATSIGEALVCTFIGLAIAILGLYFFFFLRARVNQAAVDISVITNEILDYFRPAAH